MADYYPLIAKAVAGLEKSTGETRRALYDRARTALLAQLRGVEPALSEPEITRERLALEEAIRKVEGEVAFQRSPETVRRPRGEQSPVRSDFRPDPRSEAPQEYSDPASGYDPRAPEADDADDIADVEARPAVPLSAAATARFADNEPRRADRWGLRGSSLPDDGVRSFRDSAGGAADSDEEDTVRTFQAPERGPGRFESKPAPWTKDDDDDDRKPESAGARLSTRDVVRPPTPLMDRDAGGGRALQSFPRVVRPERTQAAERVAHERAAPERSLEPAWRAPRNTNRIVAIGVIGLLALGIGGLVFWFGGDILSSMRGSSGRTADQAAPADGATSSGKILDRAPSLAASDATAPQKVVLYEEDPANPNGTQFVGTATWRTERASPSAGQKPDIFIRGDIEIPDQKVSVRLSLRRNEDPQLPASHTVEIMFTLPPDFAHGGIASIPGIMVKQGETNRGIALNGVAVKVTSNYFLVGLSSADAEKQRNVQLLKERSWFDIPIVYGDGKRALIAIEKGPPGERAFAEAFASWEQQQP